MSAVQKEQVSGENMQAVIIYDDLDVASRAIARLDNASRTGGEITRWGLKWWRLEVLSGESTAQEALAESADAHLIVLAVHNQAEISPALMNWLEGWAARRQVQDAALAVFDGASGDTLSLAASPELSEFATREGLSLIVDEGRPATNRAEVPSPGLKGLPVDPLVFAPGLRAFGASARFARHRN